MHDDVEILQIGFHVERRDDFNLAAFSFDGDVSLARKSGAGGVGRVHPVDHGLAVEVGRVANLPMLLFLLPHFHPFPLAADHGRRRIAEVGAGKKREIRRQGQFHRFEQKISRLSRARQDGQGQRRDSFAHGKLRWHPMAEGVRPY